MRRLYNKKCFLIVFTCFIAVNNLFSCNLSNLTLTSITGTGPYTINVSLCIGYGRTGGVRGADNDTRSITFAFYRTAGAVTISSFSPANITSGRGFSNCTMSSANIGPQGAPYNSRGTIIYIDPGYYGIAPCVSQPYACITTTALCGNVGQQCTNFTFVTNVRPDSIRVFGVEGGGNPVGGCYPNSDMLINFTSMLPVFWNDVAARRVNDKQVMVNWSTLSERNNYFFTVEKTDELVERTDHHNEEVDMSVWTQSGIVNGTNLNRYQNYTFVDNQPFSGVSYYRVKQTDFDGKSSYTRIVVAEPLRETKKILVYPNPAKEILTIEGENLQRVSIINLLGEELSRYNLNNTEMNSIDTHLLPKGIYFLKVENIMGDISTYKVCIDN